MFVRLTRCKCALYEAIVGMSNGSGWGDILQKKIFANLLKIVAEIFGRYVGCPYLCYVIKGKGNETEKQGFSSLPLLFPFRYLSHFQRFTPCGN